MSGRACKEGSVLGPARLHSRMAKMKLKSHPLNISSSGRPHQSNVHEVAAIRTALGLVTIPFHLLRTWPNAPTGGEPRVLGHRRFGSDPTQLPHVTECVRVGGWVLGMRVRLRACRKLRLATSTDLRTADFPSRLQLPCRARGCCLAQQQQS
jgi:hypothetical protein